MIPPVFRRNRTAVVRAVAALFPLVPVASLTLAPQAHAQNAPAPETIVITANRTPQALSSVLADISVVDRAQIERSGAVGVADLLARLPGIEISRNGGLGNNTSVFIRGNESRHTAVYVDGVRIDSQSIGGAVWEQIPLEQIERIEVLRGPAAAIYGSDAIGGVVQLFTKRGNGAPRPSVALTVGSYGTRQVQAGVSGSEGALDYAVSGSHGRSTGFNSRITPTANPDDDGWRRSSGDVRLGWQFDPRHRVEASLLASKLRSQYDGFVAGQDDWNHHSLRTASLGWTGRWSEGATTRLIVGQTHSDYETQPSYYRTETTLRNLTLQHDQQIGPGTVTLTAERRDDKLLNPPTQYDPVLQGRRHQNALGIGWRADFGAHGIQAHLRHDRDSEFGGKTTGSLAWGWEFVPKWHLTASAATSFRVPTLYQRFSIYGTPELVPETGRNVEVGLRWADARSSASLTAWRNQVREQIDWLPGGACVSASQDPQYGGCYANVGRARLQGATLAGRTAVANVTLYGSLTWQDPRNLHTDTILQRRARELATFGAETRVAGWTVGGELQAAGARYEDKANTQRLGGYGLVNLVASTALIPGLVLEGRVDNVADKDYQLARTYVTPGRNIQLSLRWTMP